MEVPENTATITYKGPPPKCVPQGVGSNAPPIQIARHRKQRRRVQRFQHTGMEERFDREFKWVHADSGKAEQVAGRDEEVCHTVATPRPQRRKQTSHSTHIISNDRGLKGDRTGEKWRRWITPLSTKRPLAGSTRHGRTRDIKSPSRGHPGIIPGRQV